MTKQQWTKANRFKLIMAGGNGVTRGATYRKYAGKKYLTVKFSTPEYEYIDHSQPMIEFAYGDHTKTLLFPRHTKMTGDELVISALQQSLDWCVSIRVNPKSVAQEICYMTCFNEMISTNKQIHE